jgi:hypothetical protein
VPAKAGRELKSPHLPAALEVMDPAPRHDPDFKKGFIRIRVAVYFDLLLQLVMDRAALLKHREGLVALRDSLSEQIAELDNQIGDVEPSEVVESYKQNKSDWTTTDYLDVATQFIILCSIIMVFVDSCTGNSDGASDGFDIYYWVFSAIFAIEYAVRIRLSDSALSYIFSTYGVIDLIGWLPEILVLAIEKRHHDTPFIQCIRCLRTLRIFGSSAWIGERGKLAKESELVSSFFSHRLGRIFIVLACMMPLLTIVASFMYVLEDEPGFNTLPLCLYWAIVTITTVGTTLHLWSERPSFILLFRRKNIFFRI